MYFSVHCGSRVESPYVAWGAQLGEGVVVAPLAVISGDVEIGLKTFINRGAEVYKADVGPYCSLGQYCQVGPNEHLTDHLTTSNSLLGPEGRRRLQWANTERTTVGADVWVGSRAVVLRGVEVGTGAIVGAGAVVTEAVPPYGIAVGIPAKVVRYRMAQSERERLVESAWWTRPHGLLLQALEKAEKVPRQEMVNTFLQAIGQA